MSSFISPFKPWFLALTFLAIIEVSYYHYYKPHRFERTNFIVHDFGRDESVQRLFTYDKIKWFADADPDVIILGDSSANHGIVPHVVMAQLPGFKVVNLGLATNVGYSGYYHLAEFMLQRNKNIKYVVLYNTPFGGHPRKFLWDKGGKLLAEDIYNEFLDPSRALLQLPTLAARKKVFYTVAYLNSYWRKYDAPLSANVGYLMFTDICQDCFGWSRETDIPGDYPAPNQMEINLNTKQKNAPHVTVETFYDYKSFTQKTYIEAIYDSFKQLANKYNAKLVVLYNPVPESAKRFPRFHGDAINAVLTSYREKNPDVALPELIEYWPDHKFSVCSHVSNLFCEESSQRVGRFLKGIITKDGANPKSRPDNFLTNGARHTVAFDFGHSFCGFGWHKPERDAQGNGWRFVGPHDRAFLYTVINPYGEYYLRLHLHKVISNEVIDQIKVRINGTDCFLFAENWGAKENGPPILEYKLPQSAVAQYLGWLKIEIDVRNVNKQNLFWESPNLGDNSGKIIAVSRLEILPQSNPFVLSGSKISNP